MGNLLPRWRGFNLLDMYIYQEGRELIEPGAVSGPGVDGGYGGGEGDFREEDLQFMREWGFDFARIPMDYRYWTEWRADGTYGFRESVMGRIDRVVGLGEKYGVHVSLSFHRAPGYCVNPPAEGMNLWTSPAALAQFCGHWRMFAERYRGVSSERLSFDLVNEPPPAGVLGLMGLVTGSGMTRGGHERVIRAAVEAIRSIDADRLIIANGLNYGTEPLPELIDTGIGQSCRMYGPFGISHYEAPWVKYPKWREPVWPGADHFGRRWGREELAGYFAKWGGDGEAGGWGAMWGRAGRFRRRRMGW